MANWQRTLNVVDLWRDREANKISFVELADAVAVRLAALRDFNDVDIDDEKLEIVDKFKEYAEIGSDDGDEFDDILANLYDWADRKLDADWNGKKVCWVKTF